MAELRGLVEKMTGEGTYKAVLSSPEPDAPYIRIDIRRLDTGFLWERRTKTQVYHETLPAERMTDALTSELSTVFRQLHTWDPAYEYSLRRAKSGRILHSRRACANGPAVQNTHDRSKQYILPEGMAVPPLVDMGVLTPDGRVVRAMYDKFKQINRFLEMVDDVLPSVEQQGKPLRVTDFGCGKSYLTFVLYHYLTQIRAFTVDMSGLDLKADVVDACNRAAQKYGYGGLRFETGDIRDFRRPTDMAVSLHACDTATDHAIWNAVRNGARYIFAAPCCQHELSGQMAERCLPVVTRYGAVKERLAALSTDAIRAHLLTYQGYRTQLLEFVDLTHTPKNLLIRAVRAPISEANRQSALTEVRELSDLLGVRPTLLSLMVGE